MRVTDCEYAGEQRDQHAPAHIQPRITEESYDQAKRGEKTEDPDEQHHIGPAWHHHLPISGVLPPSVLALHISPGRDDSVYAIGSSVHRIIGSSAGNAPGSPAVLLT